MTAKPTQGNSRITHVSVTNGLQMFSGTSDLKDALEQAEACQRDLDMDGAKEAFQKALSLDGECFLALFGLGQVHMAQVRAGFL